VKSTLSSLPSFKPRHQKTSPCPPRHHPTTLDFDGPLAWELGTPCTCFAPDPCPRSFLEYRRSKRGRAAVRQRACRAGQDCMAEVAVAVAVASSSRSQKIINSLPQTLLPRRRRFIFRVYPPNNTGTLLPAQSFSRTVAEPSTQHQEESFQQ
jgi:hypothetical protein